MEVSGVVLKAELRVQRCRKGAAVTRSAGRRQETGAASRRSPSLAARRPL